NLLSSDRSSDALKVANLIDGIHLSNFHRIDVAKPQPLKTLLSKADRDSLVGERLVSTSTGGDRIQRTRSGTACGSWALGVFFLGHRRELRRIPHSCWTLHF